MSIREKIINGISDKILVKKASHGDREAYGKLYMKYIDSIYRYIYFRLNCDRFESEDATETVFLKAWDALQNGNFNNENFRAWIYKIAHNTLVDSYRKGNKTTSLNDSIPAEVAIEEDFFQKSGKMELLQAVNKLPQEQKQVITLKFVEGLKNEEIAQIMKKSNEAVRSMQYRALSTLKKKLKYE